MQGPSPDGTGRCNGTIQQEASLHRSTVRAIEWQPFLAIYPHGTSNRPRPSLESPDCVILAARPSRPLAQSRASARTPPGPTPVMPRSALCSGFHEPRAGLARSRVLRARAAFEHEGEIRSYLGTGSAAAIRADARSRHRGAGDSRCERVARNSRRKHLGARRNDCGLRPRWHTPTICSLTRIAGLQNATMRSLACHAVLRERLPARVVMPLRVATVLPLFADSAGA